MDRSPGYRLKNKVRLVTVLFVVLTLMVGAGLWASGYLEQTLYSAGLISTPPASSDAFKGKVNVLLLGMDSRKGEKLARTDTIMLCSVDTEKNIVSILSIPRDTRVNVPGYGWEKINSTTLFGGPALATKVVSDLLGVRINNYVLTNYQGFKEIVDTLGGVTMDIGERMYHYDPEDGGIYTIDLKPGLQKLDGSKALQFVRYRGYVLGDIGRTEQQQKFLSALTKEALRPGNVIKLPSLVMTVNNAVETNLSLMDMKRIAGVAGKMSDVSIVTQTLPGKFLNYNGGSYWEVDPQQARVVVAAMFEGRAGDKVVLGESTVFTPDYKPAEDSQDKAASDKPGDKKDPKTGAVVPGAAIGTGKADAAKKPQTVTGSPATKTDSSQAPKTGSVTETPKTGSSQAPKTGSVTETPKTGSGASAKTDGGTAVKVETKTTQPPTGSVIAPPSAIQPEQPTGARTSAVTVIIESDTTKKSN